MHHLCLLLLMLPILPCEFRGTDLGDMSHVKRKQHCCGQVVHIQLTCRQSRHKSCVLTLSHCNPVNVQSKILRCSMTACNVGFHFAAHRKSVPHVSVQAKQQMTALKAVTWHWTATSAWHQLLPTALPLPWHKGHVCSCHMACHMTQLPHCSDWTCICCPHRWSRVSPLLPWATWMTHMHHRTLVAPLVHACGH